MRRHPNTPSRDRGICLAASLTVALTACTPARAPDTAPPQGDTPPAAATPATAPVAAVPLVGAGAAVPSFADLAAKVVPAVVSISVEQRLHPGAGGGGGRRGSPHGADPFDFFRFFGQQPPREYENRGLGSGFVIDASGLILTNNHVVENSDSIEVTFAMPDGEEKKMAAKVVGLAPDYDVALIKTVDHAEAPGLIPLGNSDAIRIGDWVMAVGNPFGLDHSVSVGIISAKQRRDIMPSGRNGLYDFLQTDASINPGNSGGPLLSLRGEVIGINSAINAQGQGIGFAIPINMVKEMLPTLKTGGKVQRSWIGLRIQALTPELAQSFGLRTALGVAVAEVIPKGPGDMAGLKEGDVVLEFDGKKITRASDLPLFASMAGVGKTVKMIIWRDKKEKTVSVKLEAFKDEDDGEDATNSEDGDNNSTELGLWVADIPQALRQRMELTSPGGVLVENVDPGSAAAKSGLARGDVILSLDDEPMRDARTLVKKVKSAKSGEVLRLRIQRQSARTFVALRKP